MSSNVTDNITLVFYSTPNFGVHTRVFMAEGILAFFLNSTFLFVLARNKDLFKCKRITYHVANLALADSLVGLSIFLSAIIDSGIVHVQVHFYWFHLINIGVVFVSFMSVLFMAIERIVVIKWPFTWKEILTIKRMFVAIFITWITAVIFLITPLLINYAQFWLLIFVCIGIAILIANSIIACLLQYEKRRLAAIAGTQQITNYSKEKAVKLVIMINIILVVTSLPFAVSYLTVYICNSYPRSNCNHISLANVLAKPLIGLAYTNFFVNPIIYIWRDNTYRKAFCNMFKTSTRRNDRATPV